MDLTNQNLGMGTKTFWQRKEGFTGMLIIGIIGLAILLNLNGILTWVNHVLENTLKAIFYGGILFLIGAILWYDKSRAGIWFGFKLAMRAFTGWIVTIDPIKLMREYIETLKKHLNEIYEAKGELNAAIVKLQRTIEKNRQEGLDARDKANAIRKKNPDNLDQNPAFKLNTNIMSRKDASVAKFEDMLEKQRKLQIVLDKIYDATDYMIQDKTSEVDTVEEEYRGLKAASNAMGAAKKIFRGSAQRELYNQTADYLELDMSKKIGEMNNFMNDIKSTLNDMELENDMHTDRGIAMLDKLNSQASHLIKNIENKPGSPEYIILPNKQAEPVASKSNYSNLI